MKSDRVFLAEWLGDVTDDYNDIPWPMIHETVGSDTVRWINQQPWERCQLILEKGQKNLSGLHRLYVEFYVPSARTEFALKFAK